MPASFMADCRSDTKRLRESSTLVLGTMEKTTQLLISAGLQG